MCYVAFSTSRSTNSKLQPAAPKLVNLLARIKKVEYVCLVVKFSTLRYHKRLRALLKALSGYCFGDLIKSSRCFGSLLRLRQSIVGPTIFFDNSPR